MDLLAKKVIETFGFLYHFFMIFISLQPSAFSLMPLLLFFPIHVDGHQADPYADR